MLKTLTIAVLLGLTSGRPSADSGQEIKISEPKDLIYIYKDVPKIEENFIAKLEEMPDLKHPFESLLRNRRASDSSAMDNTEASGSALPNALAVPLKAIVTLLSTTVISLVETIFGLVSGILNPILYLLTELLNPILEPLRPILNPILLPLNELLMNVLKALHLSLSLSGLLTGNLTNPASTSSLMTSAMSSPNSEPSPMTPEALDDSEPMTSDPSVAEPAGSQERRRRAISPFALSTLVTKSRSKRQSTETSIGSGINSIVAVPLMLVRNIIEAIKSIIVFPLESILGPIFSLLDLPTDLISQPLDLVESLLSNVASLLSGIIEDITGSMDNLSDGLINVLTAMLNMPNTLAERVQNAPVRQTRSVNSAESAGPLNVILSLLSDPLKTLFSYIPLILNHFNISYPTLQEAAQVFFSKAAKRFFAMVYNEMKNVILPGVDDLLQSIVGSEYIPDYMNTAIAQFHTVYQLLKMVGYLRPS